MKVRPINANAMLNELKPVGFEADHSVVLLSDVSKIMRKWVERQPTLTPPNEWVSVDENLPDFDVPVLVYVKDIFDNKGTISITKYTITYDLTNNWLGYENSSFKVTHWMPLPEPPKKEG